MLLSTINNNLKYIWDDEYIEEDYGVHEIKEITEIIQYYIDSKLFTNEEIATLLRAEFILAFNEDCINHDCLIFERIINEYYNRML